jgi:hypothetical protein
MMENRKYTKGLCFGLLLSFLLCFLLLHSNTHAQSINNVYFFNIGINRFNDNWSLNSYTELGNSPGSLPRSFQPPSPQISGQQYRMQNVFFNLPTPPPVGSRSVTFDFYFVIRATTVSSAQYSSLCLTSSGTPSSWIIPRLSAIGDGWIGQNFGFTNAYCIARISTSNFANSGFVEIGGTAVISSTNSIPNSGVSLRLNMLNPTFPSASDSFLSVYRTGGVPTTWFFEGLDIRNVQYSVDPNTALLQQLNSQTQRQIEEQQRTNELLQQQNQQHQNQWQSDKDEEAQREQDLQNQTGGGSGIFNFSILNPLSNLHFDNGCVLIPNIATWLNLSNPTICPVFPENIRNGVTPVISVFLTILTFTFLWRILSTRGSEMGYA